jgi:hypothetical protein
MYFLWSMCGCLSNKGNNNLNTDIQSNHSKMQSRIINGGSDGNQSTQDLSETLIISVNKSGNLQ